VHDSGPRAQNGFDAVLCSELALVGKRVTARLGGRNYYEEEKVNRVRQ